MHLLLVTVRRQSGMGQPKTASCTVRLRLEGHKLTLNSCDGFACDVSSVYTERSLLLKDLVETSSAADGAEIPISHGAAMRSVYGCSTWIGRANRRKSERGQDNVLRLQQAVVPTKLGQRHSLPATWTREGLMLVHKPRMTT